MSTKATPLRAYLAAEVQAGVERIIFASVVSIPAVTPRVEEATVNEVEWNIAQTRAPEVWGQGYEARESW